MKKSRSKKSSNPFVMLLIEIIDAPAWRALSHGARSLYIALRRRHNATINNNGKIHLAQRVAAQEINSHRNYVARWFRELSYYGFIVLTSAGHLGVHGRGRAPCWRLTELSYKGKPPTKDFLAWDGAPFTRPKNRTPAYKSRPLRPTKVGQGNGVRAKSAWPIKVGHEPGLQKQAKSRIALHANRGEREGRKE
jgi:hypothetical protein